MGGNVRGAAQVTADAAPAPQVATRTSFRPRPLDVNKPLKIVRNTEDLDNRGDPNAGGRGVTHGHEALDADNEAVLRVKGDGGKAAAAAEIPIPHINAVDTYEQDYRPDFKRCISYKRSGLVPEAAPAQEFVDYDLDSDVRRGLGERAGLQEAPGEIPCDARAGGAAARPEQHSEGGRPRHVGVPGVPGELSAWGGGAGPAALRD